jgi:hypothetical protein
MSEKIIWSDAERAAIAARAVDIVAEQPKLTGLPLLRAALQVLPIERRRRLIALSQTPWFLPKVREEIARRGCTDQESEMTDLIRETLLTQKGWRDRHLADLDSMQGVLRQLLEVVTAQNVRCDDLVSGDVVEVSKEMVVSVAQTQAKIVELLTHIVSEVGQLKEVIHKGPTS